MRLYFLQCSRVGKYVDTDVSPYFEVGDIQGGICVDSNKLFRAKYVNGIDGSLIFRS